MRYVKGNEAGPYEDPADVGTLPGSLLETTIKHEMMLSRSFDPQKTNKYVRLFKMSMENLLTHLTGIHAHFGSWTYRLSFETTSTACY